MSACKVACIIEHANDFHASAAPGFDALGSDGFTIQFFFHKSNPTDRLNCQTNPQTMTQNLVIALAKICDKLLLREMKVCRPHRNAPRFPMIHNGVNQHSIQIPNKKLLWLHDKFFSKGQNRAK